MVVVCIGLQESGACKGCYELGFRNTRMVHSVTLGGEGARSLWGK